MHNVISDGLSIDLCDFLSIYCLIIWLMFCLNDLADGLSADLSYGLSHVLTTGLSIGLSAGLLMVCLSLDCSSDSPSIQEEQH